MTLPSPPAPRPDEQKLRTLVDRVLILPDDPLAPFSGWKRRVAGFVWRFLGPSLQRQQAFNGAVAECVTGNVGGDLAAFITAKDREVQRVLSDGLSSVADELAKRWESMVVREQRYEARVTALSGELADMRATVATLRQLSQTLKRELEQVLAERGAGSIAPAAPASVRLEAVSNPAGGGAALASAPLDSYKYVGFEDQFRGRAEDIRANLADYLQLFHDTSDVLDVGCGRGEFLQLLSEHGISARGVDVNHEMVESCRARGLDVVEGDAVAFLRGLPECSLGGLFAAQVVEHLEPDHLLRLLDAAASKLRPGAPIVLETINPACWAAFFESYIRDLTHVRPVHPETLKYLLEASGFAQVEVRYRAPYPDDAKLQPLQAAPPPQDAPETAWALHDLRETVNANVDKLNARLFTFFDYAAVGRRM
ncbi:MAG: class I SAM-dependent methyltransferase [Bacteroidales bacterium]